MNGVKLKTTKEYDAEVAAILPEDVFRMITNPLYFPTMKAQDQKAMLLEMAGNVTNEEVANILSLIHISRVKRWVRQQLVHPTRNGTEKRSKILYSRAELLTIEKTEKIDTYINKL